MKHLEKKGDKEGAISIAEQKAWSSALQKAEGKKVNTTPWYILLLSKYLSLVYNIEVSFSPIILL